MRKWVFTVTAGAWVWLAADLAFRDWDLFPWARVTVLIIACTSSLYWVITTNVVTSWVGTIALERDARGRSIRLLPPERRGKKDLRRMTEEVVREMHAHIRSAPSVVVDALEHHQIVNVMEEAGSEDAKNEIWGQYTQRLTEKYDAERRANMEAFGSRVEYLLTEYERRGLLAESDLGELRWMLGSTHWMGGLAARLGALALRL